MYIDALLRVSSAQAFGAAAVSTSSIDLGVPGGVVPSGTPPFREIGTGEPMGFGFQISTSGTVAASLVEIISTTDAALTAGILVHAAITIPLAAALAGTVWFIPLPPGTPTQRYLGLRVTTAGGTISGTAWLTSWSLFSLLAKSYAKNYTVN
jgi:hypothetical protein